MMHKNSEEKSFGRLAFERLISNLLSVKVWLFIIPATASALFLWWCTGLIQEITLLSQKMTAESPEAIMNISIEGLRSIRILFASWLKFTGSMIVTIAGIREIWKVAKIKEDRKKEKMKQDNDRAEKEWNKENK